MYHKVEKNRDDKVLTILHLASGDLWAGAENLLFNLVLAQNKNALNSIVVVLLNDGVLANRLREASITVHIVPESRHGFIGLFLQILKLVRQLRPSITHSHRQKENVIVGLISLFEPGIRSVRTVHGGYEYDSTVLRVKLIRSLDYLVARFLQKRVIFVTTELAERLARLYRGCNTTVIPNAAIYDDIARRAQSHSETTINHNEFNVCFAGRLVDVKRIDIFQLMARELIENHGIGMAFYVFGDGPLLEECLGFQKENALQAQLNYMGFHDDILPLLKQMDCLVICSDHEGMPMIVVEAMLLGVPVVARSVGGLPEMLDHGRCGVLVESERPDSFAVAVTQLRQHPEDAHATAVRAEHHARRVFDADRMADSYREVYLHITNRN